MGEMSAQPNVPQPGDLVRVIRGPFTDFLGRILEVGAERRKLSVAVEFYGRSAPVWLDAVDVVPAPPRRGVSIALIGIGRGGWNAVRHFDAARLTGLRIL